MKEKKESEKITKKIVEKVVEERDKISNEIHKTNSFVLKRDGRESLFQGLFFSIFMFFSIPYLGIPDKYDVYYYLIASVILVISIIQIRKFYYQEISQYLKKRKENNQKK